MYSVCLGHLDIQPAIVKYVLKTFLSSCVLIKFCCDVGRKLLTDFEISRPKLELLIKFLIISESLYLIILFNKSMDFI